MTDLEELKRLVADVTPESLATFIPELIARVERAEKALKVFADQAGKYDPDEGDNDFWAFDSEFTIGDLRRARSAITGDTPNV